MTKEFQNELTPQQRFLFCGHALTALASFLFTISHLYTLAQAGRLKQEPWQRCDELERFSL